MARFKTQGLDKIVQQMKDLGELKGDVASRMLMAGAEEVKKAWQKAAEIHGHILTEQMKNSIGYARRPSEIGDVRLIDIYPQGKSTYTELDGKRTERKKPVRNAEIAFILHYGTSRRPGSHWVDTADELSEEPVQAAMEAIWDQELKKKGLI